MKELEEYTELDIIELSEDIDYLIDNPPKVRKNFKDWKSYIKSIEERMWKYNKYVDFPAYNKKFEYEKK